MTSILNHYLITMTPYPIKYSSPTLHSNALEDCEHREADVVKRRDPPVGPLPLLQARALVVGTHVRAVRRQRLVVRVARRRVVAIVYYFICWGEILS